MKFTVQLYIEDQLSFLVYCKSLLGSHGFPVHYPGYCLIHLPMIYLSLFHMEECLHLLHGGSHFLSIQNRLGTGIWVEVWMNNQSICCVFYHF